MKFVKYQSLENHYRHKTINWVERNISNDVRWNVTEKIDGANFAFYYDGKELKVASRNQFVDGTFYNSHDVIERYSASIKSLYYDLKEKVGLDYIIVRGELYGHGIQNRVAYGEKDFIAFELDLCEASTDDDEIHVSHVVTNLFNSLMAGYNIKAVPILFTGSFKECLEYDNAFDSKLLNKESNVCEGIVIKGADQSVYNQFGGRIIIKSKNEKFTEKGAKIRVKQPLQTYDNASEMLCYINKNRLDAVLSKIGGLDALTQKDFGKVIGLFSKDVIEDLVADEVIPTDYKKSEEFKNIGKWIVKQSQPLLSEEVLCKL